jgi:hypothetical protein
VGAGAWLPVGCVERVKPPLRAGTWRCCSGRGSMTARGMRGTCSRAAEGGHLDVLRWAREHHCPWDANTRRVAQQHEHLELLQWAVEHGAP